MSLRDPTLESPLDRVERCGILPRQRIDSQGRRGIGEETLTLHRLGVFRALGRSLKTTTCLESVNALIGQRTDKVDRWRSSD